MLSSDSKKFIDFLYLSTADIKSKYYHQLTELNWDWYNDMVALSNIRKILDITNIETDNDLYNKLSKLEANPIAQRDDYYSRILKIIDILGLQDTPLDKYLETLFLTKTNYNTCGSS